jgi:ABC-type branched-subunit amino acid transport system substrate-binding protein
MNASTLIADAFGWFMAASLPLGAAPPITIGLLVPQDSLESASLRSGAELGIKHATEDLGLPIRLVVRGRPGQWGTEGDDAAQLALDDSANLILTPTLGTAAHQILQVAGRTRVPVISLCPDSSVTLAGIPWVIRLCPRTEDEAAALFSGIPEQTGRALSATSAKPRSDTDTRKPGYSSRLWLAVVPPERAGREASRDLQAASRAAGCDLSVVQSGPDSSDLSSLCARILSQDPGAVLVWLDPVPAARMVRRLRQAGFKRVLAGPSRLQSPAFLNEAGADAEGFWIPSLVAGPEDTAVRSHFQAEYWKTYSNQPSQLATLAYDAVQLAARTLSQADQTAPFRAFPIRTSTRGASGLLRFDKAGNRQVHLELLVCDDGSFKASLPSMNLQLKP